MKIVCILGPTAVGKSDLAVMAAQRFDGEVINADSMQVYRHLPIGTAAPSTEMMAAVPHHLFAFLEPDAAPDAGFFARTAAEVIRNIHAKGKLPVMAGGTFFWLRALLCGLAPLPAIPDDIRKKVNDDLAMLGPQTLHKHLAEVDPVTAARLAPGDSQRIARALEVALALGRPLSDFHTEGLYSPLPDLEALKIVLTMDRTRLYDRINERVNRMMADGLLDEVRNVLARGFPATIRPFRSSSYLPVLQHLRGEITADEMRDDIAQGHRNYAKRQLTWLRHEPGAVLVDADDHKGCMASIEAFLKG